MSEKWVKNIQNGGHSKNPKVRGCSSCNIWRLMTGPEKCKWSVNILSIVHSPIRHLHDDVIWLQLPECFEASYCIQYFSFVKNRSCVTQIYITKITAKCILVVVVKWRHHANVLLSCYVFVYLFVYSFVGLFACFSGSIANWSEYLLVVSKSAKIHLRVLCVDGDNGV